MILQSRCNGVVSKRVFILVVKIRLIVVGSRDCIILNRVNWLRIGNKEHYDDDQDINVDN